MNESQKQELIKLIEPILKEKDVRLYDLVYKKENNNNSLQVLIEHDDGSMDLDTCVEVSEKLSALLDDVTFLKDEYILEVCSPGVERPLNTYDQYNKALNKYVYIKTKIEISGYKEFYGDLIEVNKDSILLSCKDKTRVKKITINFADIESAMTTVKI